MLATVLMAGAAMVCICLAVYFSGKERRLAEKMQTLIDEASKGKLKEDFKETRLSAIEASMRTFLMSQEVSVEKLKREREQLGHRFQTFPIRLCSPFPILFYIPSF